MVKSFFGPTTSTQRHVRIVSILLESAAINIPITIAGAVGIGAAEIYGLIVSDIAVTCQVGQCFPALPDNLTPS
jgi:hypothetical protein